MYIYSKSYFLYHLYIETRVLLIYMEFASGGSVKDRLNKEGAFKETQAKRYTWQMLQGVSYLHKQHIIHRDLKC